VSGPALVRVRRPRANKPGRRAFVSGKKRQNTKKATVITDGHGRTLWAGAFRPGRMHDQTALRTEGIADLFEQYPQVKAKVDAGYAMCGAPAHVRGVVSCHTARHAGPPGEGLVRLCRAGPAYVSRQIPSMVLSSSRDLTVT
jgi:hypothetical protein